MNHEDLMEYYRSKIDQNLMYPIRSEDLHKTSRIVITVKGLKYFKELQRKCIMGKEKLSDQEKVNLVSLTRVYAVTNGNLNGLKEWNEFLFRFCRDVDLLHHRTTLFRNGYVTKNPDYDPKYFEYHKTWRKTIFDEFARRRIKENGIYMPD